MLKLLKPFLVTGLTLFSLAWLLPTIRYQDWMSLILMSVILTLINAFLKPFLKLIFFPINLVTLGFFSLVLNAALLWFAVYLVPGFQVLPMTLLGVKLNYFFSLVVTSFFISFLQGWLGWIL